MELHVKHLPKLENPSVVSGLPDMGDVAGIGMNHLVKELKMEVFAEIYPYWPPSVSHKHGLVSLERKPFQFHYSQAENVVAFTGPFQPNLPHRLYELCYKVAEVTEKIGARQLFTIGAAYRGSMAGTDVYGVASRKEILDLLKARNIPILEGEGEITGFNGLMLGVALEKNVDAICLLGEIDNPEIIQPKAAGRVLQTLSRLLNFTMDTRELDDADRKIRESIRASQLSPGVGRVRGEGQPGVI